MALFRRSRDDDAALAPAVAPPRPPAHPVLASLDTMRAAPLDQLALAVLVTFLAGDEAGTSRHWRDHEGPLREMLGEPGANEVDLLLEDAFAVLERSQLVHLRHVGNNDPYVVLTRRGARALASGAPERWIDAPVDPD